MDNSEAFGTEFIYHVLYAFRAAVSDFVVVGIYTCKPDADAHEKYLRETDVKFCGAVIALTHADLIRRLTDERLGAIHADLQKLLEHTQEPETFVIEYVELRDGVPTLIRRPLRDWPDWAEEFKPGAR